MIGTVLSRNAAAFAALTARPRTPACGRLVRFRGWTPHALSAALVRWPIKKGPSLRFPALAGVEPEPARLSAGRQSAARGRLVRDGRQQRYRPFRRCGYFRWPSR